MRLDVVEVDVLPQTRQRGHRNVAFRVHRIHPAVQVGGYFFVVEERVKQAALVPAAVVHRAEEGEVAGAAAVDLALHVERLGQVDDLHARADAADVRDAGSDDVAGAGG